MAAAAAPSSFCSPGELQALTAALKNATMAADLCARLAPVGPWDDPTAGMSARLDGLTEGVNTFFLTSTGALVFVMHAGFAMVR
jgi:hypothetical protein